jgi:pimeloyl-ACP methyl ester carboxylesterase
MREWKLNNKFNFEGREVRYGFEGRGPALVLVHGTPWSSFNLRHLISGLSNSFTVYYFDLLGYGQSDKSEADVSLGIQNKLMDALLNEWQLNIPSIVGHDFGGTTVLRNHILNERTYEKIVVIDPVALSPWGSPFFKQGKDRGHILNNKYQHISFLFVLSPHTENLSKSKIEAKQMARPLRIEYPGAYYHVINRGNNQEKIFKIKPAKLRFI